MPSTPKYAEGTKVSSEKSQAEIQTLLKRHRITEIGIMTQEDGATIIFKQDRRNYKIVLPYPDLKSFRMAGNRGRTQEQQRAARNQEIRRLWRALLLVIKAKLEAITSDIVTFEEEFLSYLVVNPEGQNMYEWLRPQIDSGQMLYLPPPEERTNE